MGSSVSRPLGEERREWATDIPGLELRPAGLRQVWTLWRLEQACFGRDAWPFIDVLAASLSAKAVRLIAWLDGKPVGFVIGDRRSADGTGWVASIGVHPEYRRRGIGRRLLAACEEALGTPTIRLVLRASNEPARRLYEKAGYREVGTWRRYYADGEDGLVMEKVRAQSDL